MKQNNSLDVRVKTLNNAGSLKGYATVNIGKDFAVKNLRIIEGSKGLFVAMPSVKNHKGEYEEIFFPISKESRETLNIAVLSAYEQKLAQADSQEQRQEPTMSM